MISFEVKSSPDSFLIGKHTYLLEKLRLGQKKGDLLVDDPKAMGEGVELFLSPQGLFARSLDPGEHLIINGKKMKGHIPLQEGDEVLLGETLFQIHNFLYDPQLRKKVQIETNLKRILQEHSPVEKVLDITEKCLKDLS